MLVVHFRGVYKSLAFSTVFSVFNQKETIQSNRYCPAF